VAELKDRDWDNLLGNIRRGRSVLFIGPRVGPGAEPPMAELARRLGDLLREEGESVKGQGLPAVAQQFEDHPRFGRSDLEREAERFYGARAEAPAEAEVHARLAELPFPLYVTTGHDLALERALRATPRALGVGRYHFRGDYAPLEFASAPRAPLLYYLHGAISEPASLVLTERDLLEFLEKIVAQRPRLPDALSAHLQKRDTTFVFLGFGLRHPYLRVLLYALRINQADRSFAVEEGSFDGNRPDDTVLFYERGKITLYDAEVPAFVRALAERFGQAGGAPAGSAPGPALVHPRVFISYASEDAPHARRLREGLDRAGFEVWLDQERLLGGDRWDAAIEQAIGESDYVLVLQSQNLVAKVDSYVNKEIAAARERARLVAPPFRCLIPIEIEPAERRPDLAAYQAQPLGPARYDDDLRKLVSLITRDYQLRHRERRA
jgi:hypothetical protein